MIERVTKVKSDLYQKWYFINGCGQLVKNDYVNDVITNKKHTINEYII